MATSCEELIHWKRPWCWEGLGAGGEGDDRGWDGWMASPTQWTWVWVNSGSWWWTGRPGMLQFMGSQRVGHDWVIELNWTEWLVMLNIFSCACWPSVCHLWKRYSQIFCSFLIGLFVLLILSCKSSLYFDINHLSDITFESIFSHSVGCLFVLLMVSFTVQKLLGLIRSHLFIWLLFSLPEETYPKILQKLILKRILPMFSSRSLGFQSYI